MRRLPDEFLEGGGNTALLIMGIIFGLFVISAYVYKYMSKHHEEEPEEKKPFSSGDYNTPYGE